MEEYFQKLATNVPSQIEQAVELAAPRSFAAGYVLHRANTMASNLDQGLEITPSEYGVEDDTAEVCAPGDPTSCSIFADFTYDDGTLAGFTINDVDTSGHLVLGSGKIVRSQNAAGFELLSTYQSAIDDSLSAVFKIHSYDRAIDTSYVVTYRDPSDRQVHGARHRPPDIHARSQLQQTRAGHPSVRRGRGRVHFEVRPG